MKRPGLILIVVVALLALLGMNACSSYNNMVEKNESVTAQWQQVENQYQRRMDLIPNIVATVQGEADFEKSTLQAVVEARANATRVSINPDKLDEESLRKFEQAQGNLSSALSRLLVVAEQYPNLKANQGFADLRVELEGCENRISTERYRYNDMAKEFNTYIQKFPKNIWAGMFGFSKRNYFEMKEGADTTPNVKFDFGKK